MWRCPNITMEQFERESTKRGGGAKGKADMFALLTRFTGGRLMSVFITWNRKITKK
jgi:hypothetical protein